MTPPFLLTFEIYNMNVHTCLVDCGASFNLIPYAMCNKINEEPQKNNTQIIQLERTRVKVTGELKGVVIRLSSNLNIFQIIDIVVVGIHKAYELLLIEVGHLN